MKKLTLEAQFCLELVLEPEQELPFQSGSGSDQKGAAPPALALQHCSALYSIPTMLLSSMLKTDYAAQLYAQN